MNERYGERVSGMAKRSGVRWLFLLGLGLLLLAVVGALVYGGLAAKPGPVPVASLGGGSATARQAYTAAVEAAAQWQEDARLTAVSCHCPAVGLRSDEAFEWAFQFFSPSVRRLALVTATGEETRMVRENDAPYEVPTFSTDDWRVDSDQALRAWWGRGGGSMVERRPDTDLAMQLRVSEEAGGSPAWTVVGLIGGTDTAFTVVVDATSGELVGP
jgi:hypothetical protein